MRYYYQRPPLYTNTMGVDYQCDHYLYNRGTLYLQGDKGMVIIQQRIDEEKRTYWSSIDPWLVDQIFFNKNFQALFDMTATQSDNGLFPTMTIRQVMFYLKMKPMRRELWETAFDRTIL